MANGTLPGLAGLAQGLRMAGGILSPSAREANLDEDKLQQQQAQQMRLAQINQTVKDIEMGAIEPEAGRATLKQLGFDAPVGLSAEGQARMEKVKQQRAVADAMSKLPPDATPEQRMAAIFPHLPPEQQVRLHEINTVKVGQLEQQLERIRNEARYRDLEHMRKVDKDAQEARDTAIELRIKQQIADLKGIGGDRVNPTTVADPTDPTKSIVIDAYTGRKIGDAPGKAATEKAMPAAASQRLFENQSNLRRAKTALGLIKGEAEGGDPEATGLKGYLGEAILQRTDPSGVATRAAIADLGSMLIHDRSGAAVTAAEYPRLRPFIPLVTDNQATVKKKLERFVQVYKDISDEMVEFYKESGYRVPTGALISGSESPPPASPGRQPVSVTGANETTQITRGGVPVPVGGGEVARVRSDADFEALPSGTEFIGPDGRRRRKP